MGDKQDTDSRLAAIAAAFGREWALPAEQIDAYLHALRAYTQAQMDHMQLEWLIKNYHLDHQEVYMLSDAEHPGHLQAWDSWRDQIARILYKKNLYSLNDNATDLDDLMQMGLEELNKSLHTYRFASRFSSWVYIVIVRMGQRAIRERKSLKRQGTLFSLEIPGADATPADHTSDPETHADAVALEEEIYALLAQHGGERWVRIFQLWMSGDQRLVDIGKQVNLSPSRVSILLNQMLEMLRQQEHLRRWLNQDHSSEDMDNPRGNDA